jgi:peptidoglycan/LPS O-acetylase OafA/YrhL
MLVDFKKYRPDIDGLRAVAVLSVVAFHAFPHGKFRGGFTGVDIFFVISGYLITLILVNEMSAGTYSTVAFYRRRVLRIFPALVTVLLTCLVIGWLALLPDEFRQLAKHTFGSGAFLVNFMLWGEAGYFDSAAELKPLLHLWSLGIEEQFYIFWPLLLLAVYKSRGSFLTCAITIAAVSFSYSIYCLFFDRPSAFYNPAARTWELAAGSILAILASRGTKPKSQQQSDIISLCGITLILVGFFVIRQSGSFPGFKALLPVAGACMTIFAGPQGVINRTVLSSKIAVWTGLISYPLYLWHWPILAFLRIGQSDNSAQDASFTVKIIAVLISGFLAWATFTLIEKPIRFGRNRGNIVKLLVGTMASLMVVSGIVYVNNGLPARINFYPPTALTLFEEYPHPRTNATCPKQYPSLKNNFTCLLSQDRPAELAIVGDSHAYQYYSSLAKMLPDLSVLNVSEPRCLPFTSLGGCEEAIKHPLDVIKTSDTIKTVILTGYFSYLESDFKYGNVEGKRVAALPNAEATERFINSGRRTIQTLLDAGKQVVVMRDIPDLIFHPRTCIVYTNPVVSYLRGPIEPRKPSDCGVAVSEFEHRIRPHNETLDRLLAEFPSVKSFDPRPIFCDGRMCSALSDGEFNYWDSDHLTKSGADKVVAEFVKTIDLSQ